MIFKQYVEVLLSEKTLTTRVRLPAHIAIGKEWAIVPRRASPAWWLRYEDGAGQVEVDARGYTTMLYGDTSNMSVYPSAVINRLMVQNGFVQARIRIGRYYQTALQDMTPAEALDEGVLSVADYAVLWDAINGAGSWDTNPSVFRIRFSLTPEVQEAVSRIGHAEIKRAGGIA